jgi:diketogulonate reductase-like aldo/keto reductase
MEELALDGTGRVRAIGLSNTPASMLHELLVGGDTPVRLRPAVNQVELHPWLPQDELRTACAAHGVLLEPYAPLASGQAELLAEPVVLRLAQRLGVSPAEFLVGWALQKSGGARVVYSTRNSTRAQAMLTATRVMPRLSEADLAAMALITSRRRIFAPADIAFLFA